MTDQYEYQYKYVVTGEPLHWDNVKTGRVYVEEKFKTVAARNNFINKAANDEEQALFVNEVKRVAKENGVLEELDPKKVLTESLKHTRTVIAVNEPQRYLEGTRP